MIRSKTTPTQDNRAPPQGRGRLRWEISGVILFKLVLILVAGFTIFGARHHLHVTADVMTEQLFHNTDSPSAEDKGK